MAICANCGAELPPRFLFCGVCGARVAASDEREVRKVVTVLFCDLADSTALGEEHDPEQMRHLLRRYFQVIEQVVIEHGGLVEKFVGDAVMAVFGLPSAHEDDALRAVKAAAQVHELLPALGEETGVALAFCTGINTGEVVAGSGQTLATGDAVNVAARLENEAVPGEILLGAETVRLLGAAIEAELLPPLQLQGKAQPVQAFRFRRLAVAGEQRGSTFVGRERELALLGDAYRRVSEERELHLFTLLGPAGIGKSRLANEFCDSLGAEAQLAHGRCLSYGPEISYWPLVEILRGLGEAARPALERVLSGGATSPQELAWTVQRALEQGAEQQPLLLLLEDLHWAEPALLDLLDLVCDLSRGAPILVLCVARPELLEKRPTWAGGKLNAASVLLEPLGRGDCELLLDALERPLERGQRERVLVRAAGNPLFLEELTRFLAEGGEGELPPRIHALMQARLDLLPEQERQLLTCAAVAGTVFHRGSLDRLVPSELGSELSLHLAALTRKWLLRPARAELEGEEGYRFHHQLMRDVAYGELPKGERARLHERFACWLEERSGERGELEEIAAYHLEQAALYKRELGAREPALEARAGAALAIAAKRARLRLDVRAEAGLLRRALALLEEGDPRVPEVELELALALGFLGEHDEAYRLVEDAGRNTADPHVAANVRLVRLQFALLDASEGVQAASRQECTQAISLFEEGGDHRGLARAWHTLALAEFMELQLQAAARASANAAAHSQLAGDRAREVFSRVLRIQMLAGGRMSFATAVRELEQLTEEFPAEPRIAGTLDYYRALAAYQAGRPGQAGPLARDALAALRRAGYRVLAAFESAYVGWNEALSGDLEEGERLALAGVLELREHNDAFLGFALALLAEIRIAQGRYPEALGLADEAELPGGPHNRRTLIAANSVRARAHANLGAIEEARAAAAKTVAVAETTDSLQDRGAAQYALAEALAAAGELRGALAAAEEAGRLYTTLERTLLAKRARTLVEEIERRATRAIEKTTAGAPRSAHR